MSYVPIFVQCSLHQHTSIVIERLIRHCDNITLELLCQIGFDQSNTTALLSSPTGARILSVLLSECPQTVFTAISTPILELRTSLGSQQFTMIIPQIISYRLKASSASYEATRETHHPPCKHPPSIPQPPGGTAALQSPVPPPPPQNKTTHP